MSDESKKLHSRIRTFAADLDAQRKKGGLDTETPVITEKETEPLPKKEGVVVPEARREHVHIKDSEPLQSETKSTSSKLTPDSDLPVANGKIPPFHELQKQINSFNKGQENQTAEVPGASGAVKSAGSFEAPQSKKPIRANIGYDATVITDTKSKRFKLLPAIITSMKSWFKKITANRKKKSAPKYSVPETNHRKGVIQKATSKTGTTFTADNETLKEQIRLRRQQDKEQEAEEIHELETSWSPYTETGYNLLEAPDQKTDVTQNVTIQYKQNKAIETPSDKNKDVVSIETAHSKKEPDLVEPTLETIQPPESITATIPTENSHVDEKVIQFTEPSVPITNNEPDYVYVPEEKQKVVSRTSPKLLNMDTNILTITLLTMVIGFIVILLITRIITQQLGPDSPQATTVSLPTTKSIIKNAQLLSVTLTSETADQLPRLITSTTENAPMGLIEIPVVLPSGDEIIQTYLFKLLGFHTLSNLSSSITTARFATIDHSRPILVMKFIDEYATRGGLLSWEKSMASDFKILYELPPSVDTKFTDEIINGTDVRVLRYNNEILIIYGIVNNKTIVITSKVSDFAQLTEIGFSD